MAECSFCGRSEAQVGELITSPRQLQEGIHAQVCRHCVGKMATIIGSAPDDDDEDDRTIGEIVGEVPTPRQLIAELDQYVVGQDQAKKVISVAVHNHYKRVRQDEADTDFTRPYRDVEIDKSNVLLIGPTGCGKTEIARTLARKLGVPFAIGDATTLTEAGYVGEDVENLLLKLLYAADFDLRAAEHGIIYIDEIDKIGRTNSNVSLTRDVSGEGVQQSLLKMLEGTTANVPPGGGRKHPEQQYIRMDTSNILFICSGTFVGLEDIIAKRVNQRKIGFGNADVSHETDDHRRSRLMSQLTTKDLVDFGLIPELIGRLPVACSLNELSEEDLVRVLTEPKSSLVKQYQKQFAMNEARLIFQREALLEIAAQAKGLKTGARALRSIMEGLLLDAMVDLPGSPSGVRYLVTPAVVRGEEPLFHRAEAA